MKRRSFARARAGQRLAVIRSFGMGQALALTYFAGFTTLFFTLSIMWQQGLGHSALATGLLVLPFALGSLLTASNSFRFSRRFGRNAVLGGICGVIGAALFGGAGGSGGSGRSGGSGASSAHLMPSLVTNAQHATVVNLCFVFVALLCAFGLPSRLPGEPGAQGQRRAGADESESRVQARQR